MIMPGLAVASSYLASATAATGGGNGNRDFDRKKMVQLLPRQAPLAKKLMTKPTVQFTMSLSISDPNIQ